MMKFDGMGFNVWGSSEGRGKRISFTVQRDISPHSHPHLRGKEEDFCLRNHETCPTSIKVNYEVTVPKRRIRNTRELHEHRLWDSGDFVCEGWEHEQRVDREMLALQD